MALACGIAPPRLRPGDTVAVCAPSGAVYMPRMRSGVALLAERYRVRLADNVSARHGYLAGDDEVRAAAFNQLLHDPDVRAIIMARGAYGALRILDRLDADALRRHPKLLVGCSDATVILAWAMTLAGVRGIHGPMVEQLSRLPEGDVQWLYQLMERQTPVGRLPVTMAKVGTSAPSARLEGVLAGGNLCMLTHLLGTRFAFDVPDLVLLLEDVGERPYSIDRMLTHLGLAGVLTSAVAAVIGELVRCDETVREGHPRADEVLRERLRHYGVPALAGAPLCHGARNLALPMGARCAIEQSSGILELLDSAVV